MLKNWPVDKLSWWSCQPDASQLFGQRVAVHAVAAIPPRLYPHRRSRELKCRLLETFWVPWAARHFRRTLAQVRPEVVWMIPHCWSIPPLAKVLPSVDVPLHFSIYDYADIRSVSDRMGVSRSLRLAEQIQQLYSHAVTRDVICAAMADDMYQRTGLAASIGRAGLEQEDFDYLAAEPKRNGDSIRIGYAGTIIAEPTFAVFARALAGVRSRLARPLTLDFFGDHSYRSRSWFDPGWMKEHGNLPLPELAKALKECDWGFAPMELTDENPRYNRFSLPTKFVSYLAAGLPIIAMGHPESTVVKMASQYKIGICSTIGDAERLSDELLTAFNEPNPKSKYRPEIWRCALAEFDARQMRAVLYDNFQKCVSSRVKGK
jgi:glycosyltransferase involved in cell wall biosynthesis